ncbi:MAG: polysaccharide deacetylase family protein [Burkholderiales bacterium]|nr:polysaccharide deacetylase family protein [Burkholderiales bacterium]
MILVTSWDDGHPHDERIADMLARYGFSGTFFVPVRNSEGRPVLSGSALRRLSHSFEIGGHTLDHVYLTGLDKKEVHHQIRCGKEGVEQYLGREIKGFCYPGGRVNASIRDAVLESGFCYGRTIENLRIDCNGSPYSLPTTLQYFPHTKDILVKNFLRYGSWSRRAATLKLAIQAENWWDRLPVIAESMAHTNGVLHIWGHSWEVEKYGLWNKLEQMLKRMSSLRPASMTVLEVSSEGCRLGR